MLKPGDQLKEGDILVCSADTPLCVGIRYAPSAYHQGTVPTYNVKEVVLPRGTKVKISGFWWDGDVVRVQPFNYDEMERLFFPNLISDGRAKFLSRGDEAEGLMYAGYYLGINICTFLENFRK